MHLIFVSNYINHHQIPMSIELEKLCRQDNGSYIFMQTEPMEEERVNMGWGSSIKKMEFFHHYEDNPEKYQQMIDKADIVIFGGSENEFFIAKRLREKKLVWRYSERLYKTGRYKWISPRGLRKKFKDHTRHNLGAYTYLLCSGAYVAGDFRMIMSYIGKKYRFGYFPEFITYDIKKLINEKSSSRQEKVSFLWAGRMISWKHPEEAVLLASELKNRGYCFQLRMIGDGQLAESIQKKIKQLAVEDCVELLGFQTPEMTRKYMEKSDFFLVTSDRQEGWGAVVNEAMNSGCVVIANKAIGAAKSLIKDKQNGILYAKLLSSGNLKKVIYQIECLEERIKVGEQAYATIADEWNQVVAAKRLYAMMKATNEQTILPKYSKGPLSKHWW